MSYDNLEEGVDVFSGLFYCSNCRGGKYKKPLHCKVRNGEPIVNCNNEKCQCKCRTRYVCERGRTHPYGTKCNCIDHDSKTIDPEKEAEWEEKLKKLGIHPEQLYKDVKEN